jgi:hypothetical protein
MDAILTAKALETTIGIAHAIVNRIINPPPKRLYKDLICDDMISIGLAVGYYNNFLDLVSKTMVYSGGLTVYTSTADDKPATDVPGVKYAEENIKMEIIIPKRLDGEAFEACRKEFQQYQKGFFYSEANKRHYGINYGVVKTESGSYLRIIDLARPVMASKPFYEQIMRVATEEDERWPKTQVAEIAAFKKTLQVLQQRHYGTLVNKLTFNDIG